ncbi:short chain dehydrogenase reductase [Fusarium oxysporum II5]|nr:short chain dehydrogenase reductase [Fusarium oxysporum II5]
MTMTLLTTINGTSQNSMEKSPSLLQLALNSTGCASGIGWTAVRFIATTEPARCQYDTLATRGRTSVAKFLRYDAVAEAGRIDLATSNAGVSEQYDYFSDKSDEWGKLLEPAFGVTDVNFQAVVVLTTGRIVITSSATAHAPEHDLPVYGASKLSVLPQDLAKSLMATGLPASWAEFMDYALSRWTIQTILTLSGRYTELEEQYAEIRRSWLRWENTTITRIQEAVTDSRQPVV